MGKCPSAETAHAKALRQECARRDPEHEDLSKTVPRGEGEGFQVLDYQRTEESHKELSQVKSE